MRNQLNAVMGLGVSVFVEVDRRLKKVHLKSPIAETEVCWKRMRPLNFFFFIFFFLFFFFLPTTFIILLRCSGFRIFLNSKIKRFDSLCHMVWFYILIPRTLKKNDLMKLTWKFTKSKAGSRCFLSGYIAHIVKPTLYRVQVKYIILHSVFLPPAFSVSLNILCYQINSFVFFSNFIWINMQNILP